MIKDLLFPKICFNCNRLGKYLCNECCEYLPSPLHQRCIICQKPSLGGWTHPKCVRKQSPARLLTLFDYQNKLVAQLINSAKLSLAYELLEELADTALSRIRIENHLFSQFVICPIPQTKTKLRKRGYNHSEVIAKVWSKNLHMTIDKVLIKPRNTKEQKQLSKSERKSNLQNAFQINQPEYIPKQILLIDDITTTGATFREAAKVLLRAGAKTVWCLALAQD